MPSKKDPRLDAYLADAPAFAQPILKRFRKLIHEGCPEVEETIKWSHPSFLYQGKILCSFATFKAHCSFGFWHQEMNKQLEKDGYQINDAAGSFGRIAAAADVPDDQTLLRYIRLAVQHTESDAPSRPRPTPAAKARSAALETPPDLVALLAKNAAAKTTFEKFSPSHRKEYIEWITEAKRPETREKRLAQTIEWLAEGKSRNWKYANC